MAEHNFASAEFVQLIDEVSGAQRRLADGVISLNETVKSSREVIAESCELILLADELLVRR